MDKMMKTGFKQKPNQLKRSPASIHNDKHPAASELVDNRSSTTLQRQLMKGIDNTAQAIAQRQAQAQLDDSPVMMLQRQQLEGSFGQPIQRVEAEEEEELLQGKFETMQRQGDLEEEELLQGKFETVQRQSLEEEEEPLQGKFTNSASPTQLQEETTQSGNRTGMPDHLKAGIESLSGMDMSDVQVHRNSSKPAQLNALAYAQGNEIHLGPGQEQHLPHEAWHVVQQRQGRVKPTRQMAGEQINDDVVLETEADVMGANALQFKSSRKGANSSSSSLNRTAIQRVIQLGEKYDKVKIDASHDLDEGDYDIPSVSDDALKAATIEILTEHLAGKKYVGQEGGLLETPDIMISNSWGGAPGKVLMPAKLQSAMQIHTGEFIPNLMHETGHMVKGQQDSSSMKDAIALIAKDAKVEAAKQDYASANPKPDEWEEEVRADLTGVHMRWLSGSKPTEAEYKKLAWADDPADESHPPGTYRIAKITAYLQQLESG